MKLTKREKKLIKKHRNRPIWDIYIPMNRDELDLIIGRLEDVTLKSKLIEYRGKL